MKALILSAGLGTRLAPITNTIPKALAPVNGIPIIHYVIALLKKHGIREFILNLHHHAEKIPELLGNGEKLGVSITYSREPVILGTGGGIKKMLGILEDHDDDVLVANGDVIADFDVTAMIAQHKKNRPLATFALYDHPNKSKYGLLSYQDQKLFSILNKPPPPPHAKTAMFASFHMVNKKRLEKLLSVFANEKMFCIMNDVYIPFIQDAQKYHEDFGGFVLDGFWRACDSLEDIQHVEQLLNASSQPLSYAQELRLFS
jgi:NDP-sugar pyrophosphorylase family protein